VACPAPLQWLGSSADEAVNEANTSRLLSAAIRSKIIRFRLTARRDAKAAKAFLKQAIETIRNIKHGHTQDRQPGVLRQIAFVKNLFKAAA
jgi:hypothetical protein